MERISQVQLNSGLMARAPSLQRSLSNEDLSILLAEMDILTRRYPSQDQEESIEVYQQDLERLALRYSLAKVIEALEELRITPGRMFFPRPDEVAGEIERQQLERNREADVTRSQQRREQEIEEFWKWAPQWMSDTGNTEAELLERFPSFRGTKPGPVDVCRHCGCTEASPCRLATGDSCWWTDPHRTACSNPVCIRAEATRKRTTAAA